MVTDIEKKIKPRSVADPVPGSGIRWIPSGSRILDPGWVKSQALDQGSGAGRNNPDHISESLETIFLWVKIK
jgi:hypothetical protein